MGNWNGEYNKGDCPVCGVKRSGDNNLHHCEPTRENVDKWEAKAREYSGEFCHNKRKWIMSIPVHDADPDMVFGEAMSIMMRRIDYLEQALDDFPIGG